MQMQTRSMQRKSGNAQKIETNIPEPDQLKVIDAINYEQVRNMKKLSFCLIKAKPPFGSMTTNVGVQIKCR